MCWEQSHQRRARRYWQSRAHALQLFMCLRSTTLSRAEKLEDLFVDVTVENPMPVASQAATLTTSSNADNATLGLSAAIEVEKKVFFYVTWHSDVVYAFANSASCSGASRRARRKCLRSSKISGWCRHRSWRPSVATRSASVTTRPRAHLVTYRCFAILKLIACATIASGAACFAFDRCCDINTEKAQLYFGNFIARGVAIAQVGNLLTTPWTKKVVFYLNKNRFATAKFPSRSQCQSYTTTNSCYSQNLQRSHKLILDFGEDSSLWKRVFKLVCCILAWQGMFDIIGDGQVDFTCNRNP